MHKRTKDLQFDSKTVLEIHERDVDCIFCRYFGPAPYDNGIFDTAHVVNKSQGGLGAKENGVRACRYHHNLMDNGTKGDLYRRYAESYLKSLYPGWNIESVTYKKGIVYE